MDAHKAINAEVSLVNVGDSEVLLTLLNPLRRKVQCHKVLQRKGIIPLIPPHRLLGYRPKKRSCTSFKNGELAQWEVDSDYHSRSIFETVMSRYKGLTSGQLRLRNNNAQVGEATVNVKAMNKVYLLSDLLNKASMI